MSNRPHSRKRNNMGQTAEAKKHGSALPKDNPGQGKCILCRIKNLFQRKPH